MTRLVRSGVAAGIEGNQCRSQTTHRLPFHVRYSNGCCYDVSAGCQICTIRYELSIGIYRITSLVRIIGKN
jgi:hypothetical protein